MLDILLKLFFYFAGFVSVSMALCIWAFLVFVIREEVEQYYREKRMEDGINY